MQVGEGAAAAAKDVLASAVDGESDLHQQRSVLEQEQQAAKRREEQLVKKVCHALQGFARPRCSALTVFSGALSGNASDTFARS